VENGARSTYGTYASCLKTLGLKLDPPEQRFYMIGFASTGDNWEKSQAEAGQQYGGNFYLAKKLGVKNCYTEGTPEAGNHFFPAGKTLPGSGKICSDVTVSSCIPKYDVTNPTTGKPTKKEATEVRRDHFTAMAAGYIYVWPEDQEAKADQWIINQKKDLKEIQMGY